MSRASQGPRQMTLPTDSSARKEHPLMSGCLNYFPAALAGVALISKLGNDKHNPGQPLHHARGKSTDHGDCVLRHLVDVQDLLAADERSALTPKGIQDLLNEASSLAWRALALSQELHERFGAPLAPAAKVTEAYEELKKNQVVRIKNLTQTEIDSMKPSVGFNSQMKNSFGKLGVVTSIDFSRSTCRVRLGDNKEWFWPLWAVEKVRL